jgi:hypothetical protein
LTTIYLNDMSLRVIVQSTSAIAHYPIFDSYDTYSFCTHQIYHISLPYIWVLCHLKILHTPHFPYLTKLYLTAMLIAVFAHITSAISHYPISDSYEIWSFCTHHICHISLRYIWQIWLLKFCTHHICHNSLQYIWQLWHLKFLYTPYLPYLTKIYLRAMTLEDFTHTTSAISH